MIELIAIALEGLGFCAALIATFCLVGLVGTELAERSEGAAFRFLEGKPRSGTQI
jgi:hypothetical protein